MFELTDPQIFWVNATNLVLGLVTLCCTALIASVVVNELIERWVGHLVDQTQGDGHAIHVSGLGLTMADGGEPTDDEKAKGPDFYGF
jgi:hypothetical protein